jgi:hypothetical protein
MRGIDVQYVDFGWIVTVPSMDATMEQLNINMCL